LKKYEPFSKLHFVINLEIVLYNCIINLEAVVVNIFITYHTQFV
jgi:hypothetical protein